MRVGRVDDSLSSPVSRTYANPIPIESIGQTGCPAGTYPTVRTPSPVPVLQVSMPLSLPADLAGPGSALSAGRLPVTRVYQPRACGSVSAVGLAIAWAGAWLWPPVGGRDTRAVPPGCRRTRRTDVGGWGAADGTSCVLWTGSLIHRHGHASQRFQRTVTNPVNACVKDRDASDVARSSPGMPHRVRLDGNGRGGCDDCHPTGIRCQPQPDVSG